MKVIILAGGKGTRLPISAKNIPKPLVKIGKKTILEHQLDLLKSHGFIDFRLSLGHKYDKIIDYCKKKRINVEFIIEKEPLGTGGAIKHASKDLKDYFLALNGDILSDFNFREFVDDFNNKVSHGTLLGSIAIWKCQDCSDYGLICHKNGFISEFLEKPSQKCAGYINTGFYILSPKIFKNVPQETFSIEHEIFPKLAIQKYLSCFIHRGFWTDVGTEKRLEEAKILINKGKII